VLGNPACHSRFGFAPHAEPVYPGRPASHFTALALKGIVPIGEVKYHTVFDQSGR
jgi:putative acetyltransferase